MADKCGYYIGVDVGTQSVRAGLVTMNGMVVKTASQPTKTWNPYPDEFEQSSEEIWDSCIAVINIVIHGIDKNLVRGIGFDATCSLVALDKKLQPLSISKTGNSNQNVILWMDHRATEEANFITELSHPVLKFTGGKMSPEMQPSKLLWLKKNLPDQWDKVGHFFDLPDFLTWKATGNFTRSLCSLVCKWTYQAGTSLVEGWQDSFWQDIGLNDLISNDYEKIGNIALSPGDPCGNGLLADVACKMGLMPNVPVATSIIDAHAGGIGLLLCSSISGQAIPLENRMALICGTSTCHMKVSKHPIFTSGVWGPYYSAMVPGLMCTEAGQSAAGLLVDHIINSSLVAQQLRPKITNVSHITDFLNAELEDLKQKKGLRSLSYLTADIHVWPDYHGNRSPLSDSTLRGMICGLTLAEDKKSLAQQYLATIQALAYSTKHIIDCLEISGHVVQLLLACGGLSKNPLYVQMHADITGLPLIIPMETESVLLGSAILASKAANDYSSVESAMENMCGTGKVITPCLEDKSYHEVKYQAFLKLLECQKDIQKLMHETIL